MNKRNVKGIKDFLERDIDRARGKGGIVKVLNYKTNPLSKCGAGSAKWGMNKRNVKGIKDFLERDIDRARGKGGIVKVLNYKTNPFGGFQVPSSKFQVIAYVSTIYAGGSRGFLRKVCDV